MHEEALIMAAPGDTPFSALQWKDRSAKAESSPGGTSKCMKGFKGLGMSGEGKLVSNFCAAGNGSSSPGAPNALKKEEDASTGESIRVYHHNRSVTRDAIMEHNHTEQLLWI